MRRLPEDYTSHVYLNEDFEGGNFFFADDMQGSNPVPIQPTCGRMLAYSSGFENLHGVTAVRGSVSLHHHKSSESMPLISAFLQPQG